MLRRIFLNVGFTVAELRIAMQKVMDVSAKAIDTVLNQIIIYFRTKLSVCVLVLDSFSGPQATPVVV